MANKLFKGFRQEIEGNFTPEAGFLYFVRKESNTGKTDGYILFNERKYGTAEEVAAELKALIGTLPSGYTDVAQWITDNERVTSEALTALDARIDSLSGSSHSHSNKTVLDGITAEKVSAWDAAEQNAKDYSDVLSGNVSTALENVLNDSKVTVTSSVTGNYAKVYTITQSGATIGTIDIPKDMVVSRGEVTDGEQGEKVLRLYIANTDPEEHVDIAISDLAHVYTQGDGVEISASDVISAKVVAANGLSVDQDGIKLALATASSNGALSSGDFTKLVGIQSGAQVNVIEGVQVNGTDLTVDGNKKVNVVLPDATVTGESNGVRVEIAEVDGALTGVTVTAPDFANTYASKSEFESFSGTVDDFFTYLRTDPLPKIAALEAISADTRIPALEAISADTRIPALEAADTALDSRIDALEAISGQSHEHANKDVLDGIDAADVAKWDAALQSISAADNSVTVGAKDASGNQTVAVKLSAAANNALTLESDGLFAAIYYDGNDSD